MEKSLTNQTAAVKKDAVAIGGEVEDPFNRLPDELIISQIFDRLSEVRYLFMCSLVSRRFASLILQTHNVSVTIPCIIQSRSLSFPQKFRRFLSKPFSFLKELLHPTKRLNKPSYDLDEKFLSSLFSGFLGNLSSVHSLKVEVSSTGSETVKEFSVMWLFEFKSANSGRLIILFFKSLTAAVAPDTDKADDNSNSTGNGYQEMSIDDAISFASFMITDGLLLYNLLGAVVPFYPKLGSAVISDSSKRRRLVVREEKIVQMRAGDEALEDIDAHLKVWDEAVLKLPLSGVMMKDVRLAIVQSKVEGEVRQDDLTAEDTNFEFEEDEEEMAAFGEAVTEMMKNNAVVEENLTVQNSACSSFF